MTEQHADDHAMVVLLAALRDRGIRTIIDRQVGHYSAWITFGELEDALEFTRLAVGALLAGDGREFAISVDLPGYRVQFPVNLVETITVAINAVT